MELDDIKNSWNQPGEQTGADKIAEMIGKRSQGPIAKMKRNLRFELLTVLLGFGLVSAYYFIEFESRYSIISWVYAFLIVLFCYYFSKKNKLLNEMQCSSCRVKSNLELQLKMLEKYVRFYLISGTAAIPLLIIFLGIVLYYKKSDLIGKTIFFPSAAHSVWKFLLAWVILLSLTTIIMWLANRSYVNSLYGRHIKRLKQLLAQIDE
jgi:hypothetical protein